MDKKRDFDDVMFFVWNVAAKHTDVVIINGLRFETGSGIQTKCSSHYKYEDDEDYFLSRQITEDTIDDRNLPK